MIEKKYATANGFSRPLLAGLGLPVDVIRKINGTALAHEHNQVRADDFNVPPTDPNDPKVIRAEAQGAQAEINEIRQSFAVEANADPNSTIG